MLDIPDQWLLSRIRSVWNFDPHPSTTLFSIPDAWTTAWSASLPVTGDLIVDLNVRPPGFDLRRHNWVLLNRFRTEQGRCAHLMHRWGFVESPACDCGAEEQTMRHIVDCVVCDERRDSGVPIWLGLESLTNVLYFKIMVIRIKK
jgi:hypothetical protein